jgi:hypothetical protein
MTNNNSVPGMMLPTQKGMTSGNPRDSAIQNMNSNQQSAAVASKLLSGGKSKKRVGGDNINVPQYQMPYEPQGGPGTNPNNQIQGNARTSTQSYANAAGDSGATQTGGFKRGSRKGGNPDWLWGCMSGGKSRRKRSKSSKSRKRRRRSKRKY